MFKPSLHGLLSVTLLLTAVPPASAEANKTITLEPIGTHASNAFDQGAAEIVAHDPVTQRVFVVNAQAATVDVLTSRIPQIPQRLGRLM